MNWLAHAFLSKPDVEFRLGNLLADLIKGRQRAGLPAAFQAGMRQHQAIDAFTDSHPIVRRSRARISGYRHLTGVLVDVFYDHYLALHWSRYSAEPLDEFTRRLYADLHSPPIALPAEISLAVTRMICDDRLGSYRRIEGVATALQRISMRLSARSGKDMQVEKAVSELVANYQELEKDFAEFFPLLQRDVAEQ